MRDYGIIKRYEKGVSMDISEIRQKIDANREKLASLEGVSLTRRLEEEIAILENKMTEPDFWNDNIAAQKNVARIK